MNREIKCRAGLGGILVHEPSTNDMMLEMYIFETSQQIDASWKPLFLKVKNKQLLDEYNQRNIQDYAIRLKGSSFDDVICQYCIIGSSCRGSVLPYSLGYGDFPGTLPYV